VKVHDLFQGEHKSRMHGVNAVLNNIRFPFCVNHVRGINASGGGYGSSDKPAVLAVPP
jgi:hypothetical protein